MFRKDASTIKEWIENSNKALLVPIYMSYLLQEPKTKQLIVDLDMLGL